MSNPIDEAVKARAKEMYFHYIKPQHICKELGIQSSTLSKWVDRYGTEGWWTERKSSLDEQFAEDNQRNLVQASNFTKVAVDFLATSIQERTQKKNKRGEKIPLDVYEMDALASSMIKLAKIMSVNPGIREVEPEQLAAPIKDVSPMEAVVHNVIDTQKVLTALSRDKAMMARLERLQKEKQDGRTNERESSIESDAGRSDEAVREQGSEELRRDRDLHREGDENLGRIGSAQVFGDSTDQEVVSGAQEASIIERELGEAVEQPRKSRRAEFGNQRASSEADKRERNGRDLGLAEYTMEAAKPVDGQVRSTPSANQTGGSGDDDQDVEASPDPDVGDIFEDEFT